MGVTRAVAGVGGVEGIVEGGEGWGLVATTTGADFMGMDLPAGSSFGGTAGRAAGTDFSRSSRIEEEEEEEEVSMTKGLLPLLVTMDKLGRRVVCTAITVGVVISPLGLCMSDVYIGVGRVTSDFLWLLSLRGGGTIAEVTERCSRMTEGTLVLENSSVYINAFLQLRNLYFANF